MLKHYILFSIRKIHKQKFYSIFNTLGLSIGLSLSFLILLFIINQTGFDKQHTKKDSIYRLLCNYHPEGSESNYALSYWEEEVITKLNDEYPEVQKIASLYRFFSKITVMNHTFLQEEPNVIITESEITDIFTFPVIKGDPSDLLTDDYNVLITESKSKIYFGNQNPIGEILTLKTTQDTILLKVKAIIKDFPENSTLKPDFIIRVKDCYKKLSNVFPEETYLLINPDADIDKMQNKMPEFRYDFGTIMISKYALQSFNDIYFRSDFLNYNPKKEGNIEHIYILSIIALIIFLVSINYYIIYSIFDTKTLIKDIAIKKTLGASIKNIRTEQLISSLIYLSTNVIIALFVTYLLIPIWNKFFEVNLYPTIYENYKFIAAVVVILLFASFSSGGYITFYISRLNPFELFHSSFISIKSIGFLQKAILTFQIILFIGLLSFSITIRKQLNYASIKDSGFDIENLLQIDFTKKELKEFYFPFVDEIKKLPFVENVSGAYFPIPNNRMMKKHVPKYKNTDQNVILNLLFADKNYFRTMKIDLRKNYLNDNLFRNKKAIIINEAAAQQLGINKGTPMPVCLSEERAIIIEEICNNFDIQGIKQKSEPLGIQLSESEHKFLFVRLKTDQQIEALNSIKTKYKNITKGQILSAAFVKDNIKQFYKSDYKLLKAIQTGTFLTILISFISLINVYLLSLKSRTKELLLRKFSGANEFYINILFIKDQLKILFLALIISIPISVWLINKWLNNYAQHINVSSKTFIISIILAFICMSFASLISTRIIYRKSILSNLNKP
ncbi:MAG: ABC transporter permease [Bacteroidales bacterium]|nr:ABC transporter permease [Bacteroidales bacterium]